MHNIKIFIKWLSETKSFVILTFVLFDLKYPDRFLIKLYIFLLILNYMLYGAEVSLFLFYFTYQVFEYSVV